MGARGKMAGCPDASTSMTAAVRLFIPCYVDQLAPEVGLAAVALLERLQVAWSYPAAQTCCGQLAYNAGDWQGARRLRDHFCRVFAGAGPVVCPGPSCVRMVRRHYLQLRQGCAGENEKELLVPHLVDMAEFLHDLLPFPFSLHWPDRVFLHQSCAARELGLAPVLKGVLAQVTGLELCTLPEAYACCGFGGWFALKQPELSQAIGWRYLEAVLATGARLLVSPDVGCLLHLQGLVRAHNLPLACMHLAPFLQEAARRGSP